MHLDSLCRAKSTSASPRSATRPISPPLLQWQLLLSKSASDSFCDPFEELDEASDFASSRPPSCRPIQVTAQAVWKRTWLKKQPQEAQILPRSPYKKHICTMFWHSLEFTCLWNNCAFFEKSCPHVATYCTSQCRWHVISEPTASCEKKIIEKTMIQWTNAVKLNRIVALLHVSISATGTVSLHLIHVKGHSTFSCTAYSKPLWNRWIPQASLHQRKMFMVAEPCDPDPLFW